MTSPVVEFSDQDPIARAEEIFVRKRFRHVPVVDEKNTLCGILSDRDWMRWKLEHITMAEQTIGQIMKTKVLSVRIFAGIGEISKVFFEERIGCLPVVNDQFQVIGIITRSDVLRAILRVSEREFSPRGSKIFFQVRFLLTLSTLQNLTLQPIGSNVRFCLDF